MIQKDILDLMSRRCKTNCLHCGNGPCGSDHTKDNEFLFRVYFAKTVPRLIGDTIHYDDADVKEFIALYNLQGD